MAFLIKDRVLETCNAPGTGAVTPLGAVTGYQSFSAAFSSTNGTTTYYCIADQGGANWEVGLGTWNTGNTITRTTVLASSNGGSTVNFSTGTQNIFCTYPSEKAVIQDVNGNISGNSFTPGWTSITTSAGTTTLTNASTYYQRFVGSTTQTVVLPDATTVAKGQGFILDNDSSGAVALQDGSTASLGSVVSGMAAFVFCENNSTTAGSWSGYQFVPGAGPSGAVTWGTAGIAMGGGAISGLNTLSMTGQLTNTVATGTAPFVVSSTTQVANLNAATAGNVTGIVAVANGGTGASTVSGAQSNLQVDPAGTAIAMSIALG